MLLEVACHLTHFDILQAARFCFKTLRAADLHFITSVSTLFLREKYADLLLRKSLLIQDPSTQEKSIIVIAGP